MSLGGGGISTFLGLAVQWPDLTACVPHSITQISAKGAGISQGGGACLREFSRAPPWHRMPGRSPRGHRAGQSASCCGSKLPDIGVEHTGRRHWLSPIVAHLANPRSGSGNATAGKPNHEWNPRSGSGFSDREREPCVVHVVRLVKPSVILAATSVPHTLLPRSFTPAPYVRQRPVRNSGAQCPRNREHHGH